jgi:hypothetical protein
MVKKATKVAVPEGVAVLAPISAKPAVTVTAAAPTKKRKAKFVGVSGNKAKRAAPHTSKFRGCNWDKSNGKWQVRVTHDGKTKTVGYFRDETEAAKARDDYCRLHALNRPMNFGPNGEVNHKQRYSSKYTGVSWCKSTKRWLVQARHAGRHAYIGQFKDEEEAGRAYDNYVLDKKLNRSLNFPDSSGKTVTASKVD